MRSLDSLIPGTLHAATSDDAQRELADAVDVAMQLVAALDRADAGRRPGKNQIARLQREQPGQVGDHFRHFPDQLIQVAALFDDIVHFEPHRALARMADAARRRDRRTRRGAFKGLADFTRSAEFFRLAMQVTAWYTTLG